MNLMDESGQNCTEIVHGGCEGEALQGCGGTEAGFSSNRQQGTRPAPEVTSNIDIVYVEALFLSFHYYCL